MKSFIRWLESLILLAVLTSVILAATHVQALTDWVKLYHYTPPSAVSALASEDNMTPYAQHVFYINHPNLESNVSAFEVNCTIPEQTIVLGCYHSLEAGIELHSINDPRLAGVEQVTAAHEMLHGAYDRLSTKDRNHVDAMLSDYYQHDLTDQRIKDTIADYKKTEPNDVVNEMHSVFGTEVPNLPAPLENYYKRYFIDRSKITDYAADYEDQFTNRENAIKSDAQALATQKAQITNEESELKAELNSLQHQRSQINGSDSQSEVNNYNSQVDNYNNGVQKLESDITAYNQLVQQYNSVAAELSSLQNSLQTGLSTQTAQ